MIQDNVYGSRRDDEEEEGVYGCSRGGSASYDIGGGRGEAKYGCSGGCGGCR